MLPGEARSQNSSGVRPKIAERNESNVRILELDDSELRMVNQERVHDEFASQVKWLEEAQLNIRVTCEIAPGLGEITVAGNGDVIGVNLDEAALRISDRSKLGQRVLAALTAARRQAHARYEHELRQLVERLAADI